jgi:recombination protein RecT
MNAPHPADTLGKGGQGRALASWDAFQSELRSRESEIATLLPRHVSKERFLASAAAAVKQNPDLLTATPRSLFQAITQSAQDGLLPDGREGVITVYNEKVKNQYEKRAKWNPMTWGLRKRARELEGLIIDCQVVHRNDHFIWHQGDDPRLEHVPAQLGTPRGDMIGAYAIFKDGHGHILHREIMDVEQIGKVRSQSKQPDGMLWVKFAEEGWKKTVLRRGIKSVPCSENLQSIVQRDDDGFQFEENGRLPTPPAPPKAATPRPVEQQPAAKVIPFEYPDIPDCLDRRPKHKVEEAHVISDTIDASILPASYVEDTVARFMQAEGIGDIERIWEDYLENGEPRLMPMDKPKIERAYENALQRTST